MSDKVEFEDDLLYYFESSIWGCGIRTGANDEDLRSAEVVRFATKEDINRVRAMGGWVPEVADEPKG